jgi:hypothetical protein
MRWVTLRFTHPTVKALGERIGMGGAKPITPRADHERNQNVGWVKRERNPSSPRRPRTQSERRMGEAVAKPIRPRADHDAIWYERGGSGTPPWEDVTPGETPNPNRKVRLVITAKKPSLRGLP